MSEEVVTKPRRNNWFKAGRPVDACYGYVPIGTTRIRNGQLLRKVTDDRSTSPARRWVPVARLVWEATHGPIPNGLLVTFKEGRSTTDESKITPDCLELVDRSQLMRRNNYFNALPREVAEIIQLKGALTRKINRRSKQA
jgi:hypothetical protein